MRLANRRTSLRAAGLLTAAALVAAGCSSTDETAEGGSAPSGPWSYTTSFGNTVETAEFPERVVADVYSTVALWDYGIRPVGAFGYGFDTYTSHDGVDISSVPVIGKDAEFSLETYTGLDPQVVVGYGLADAVNSWTWWEPELAEKVNQVAPFLGVNFGGIGIDGVLAEYRKLAEALGGDVDGEQVAQDREDYEAAKERVRQVAASRPEISVVLISGAGPIYVGTKVLGQLAQLDELGVHVTVPKDESEKAWGETSWENFRDLDSDLLFVADPAKNKYADSEIYTGSPAVRAGQVGEWDDKRANTYRSYAAWLNSVADAIEGAKDVV